VTFTSITSEGGAHIGKIKITILLCILAVFERVLGSEKNRNVGYVFFADVLHHAAVFQSCNGFLLTTRIFAASFGTMLGNSS